MGWSIGYDYNWKRDIGYGVPCVCDHPDCDKEIDRGLAHVCCDQEPYGGDDGCGLFFCGEHLRHYRDDLDDDDWPPDKCERCAKGEDPFEPKPDIQAWIDWKETDPSWQQWRDERDAKQANT